MQSDGIQKDPGGIPPLRKYWSASASFSIPVGYTEYEWIFCGGGGNGQGAGNYPHAGGSAGGPGGSAAMPVRVQGKIADLPSRDLVISIGAGVPGPAVFQDGGSTFIQCLTAGPTYTTVGYAPGAGGNGALGFLNGVDTLLVDPNGILRGLGDNIGTLMAGAGGDGDTSMVITGTVLGTEGTGGFSPAYPAFSGVLDYQQAGDGSGASSFPGPGGGGSGGSSGHHAGGPGGRGSLATRYPNAPAGGTTSGTAGGNGANAPTPASEDEFGCGGGGGAYGSATGGNGGHGVRGSGGGGGGDSAGVVGTAGAGGDGYVIGIFR